MVALRTEKVKTAPKIGVPFAPLPLDVMRNRGLSPSAKLTFMALANQARMRRGEVSTLTNRRIAEATGQSEAAVRRALDELEAAGLIRRLYGASQRVRVGVAVTYSPAEAAQGRATPAETVAPGGRPGCAGPAAQGCAPAPTDLLRTEELPKTAPIPSREEEDPEEAARYAALGYSGYFSMCAEAGRREAARAAQPKPPRPALPPAPVEPPRTPPPPGPPRTPEGDARRAVESMAAGCFRDARRSAWGPLPGRRRMTPAELQRQLAEVRRKYGKAGGRDGVRESHTAASTS